MNVYYPKNFTYSFRFQNLIKFNQHFKSMYAFKIKEVNVYKHTIRRGAESLFSYLFFPDIILHVYHLLIILSRFEISIIKIGVNILLFKKGRGGDFQ